MLHQLLPFLIASALGLVIGIERERRNFKEEQALGVRTFILLGLLGALAGWVEQPLIALAITIFVAAAIIASYIRTSVGRGAKSGDVGLTTEMAAAATFILGFLAQKDPLLSAVLGLLVLIVLLSRTRLHRFSRYQLKANEIQAAVILFVLALGIVPLLPQDPIDPWGLFSLQRFATIVTLIASVEFAGYVAMRVFGGKTGIPLSGFLAGFVSSTATFLTLPNLVKKTPTLTYAAASSAIFASTSTLLLLLAVVTIASPSLFAAIVLPILSSIIMSTAAAFILARSSPKTAHFIPPGNPLSLKSALKLGAFLMTVLIAIGALQKFVGTEGASIASFVGGLAELHGVTFANATLFIDGEIDQKMAINNIMCAVVASMLSKLAITWTFNHGKYALVVSSALLASLLSLGVVWWFL